MEFEFDVRINNIDDHECRYSSANELFANGKILPLQIKTQQKQPPVLAGTGGGSMNRNRGSSHSTPKVKPDGHRNRKGNQQRQNKKSSFNHGHGNGTSATPINPILNVPLVDVFCLSSLFLSGRRKK
ncbi:hypothetical protein V6N13_046055 [Hibiscus sabdariffa]|uniref:Uncharacterized protein n=2 Tax=Hibiscus sabdariffa TaxID=183260 RepID=A0ABR2AEA9_9ROSI